MSGRSKEPGDGGLPGAEERDADTRDSYYDEDHRSADDDDDLFFRRDRERERDRERDRGGLGVSDFVRRAIENTVGSVQNTGTMSKEALHYVIQQGDRGRREVVRIVASEVGDFLRKTDLSQEVVKILTSVQMDFNATIKFRPTEDGLVKAEAETDLDIQPAEGEVEEEPGDLPDLE